MQSIGTFFLNGCSVLMSQSMISFQNSVLHVHIRPRTFCGSQNSEFRENVVFVIQEPEPERESGLIQDFGARINAAARPSFSGLISSLLFSKPQLHSLLSQEEDSRISRLTDSSVANKSN
jgi:hypothetical protein